MATTQPSSLMSHRDPFSSRLKPPKIDDGKASMSSAIKLRMTGQVTLPTTAGAYVDLCLGPGLSSNFLPVGGVAVVDPADPTYAAHMATQTLRDQIKQVRLVGAAARFSLLNNAEQNEGYWEAIRVPFCWSDINLRTRADPTTEPVTGSLDFTGAITAAGTDFSQHMTYQTGKLKDLHKYQFKLNSVTNEHPFTCADVIGDGLNGPTQTQLEGFVDETFDIVIIRVFGRNEASFPSAIRYDVVSNQEVVWKENSQSARMMTKSQHNPQFANILDRSNYEMPGLKMERAR